MRIQRLKEGTNRKEVLLRDSAEAPGSVNTWYLRKPSQETNERACRSVACLTQFEFENTISQVLKCRETEPFSFVKVLALSSALKKWGRMAIEPKRTPHARSLPQEQQGKCKDLIIVHLRPPQVKCLPALRRLPDRCCGNREFQST